MQRYSIQDEHSQGTTADERMAVGEVISIGDELTSGQRLDTNSQWIASRLGDLGVRVGTHVTVADEFEANVRVFREACDRADVIVCSGGLGPTADDLTREVIAKLLGVELMLDEGALAHVRSLFAARNRPMPEGNIVQAMFPQGSSVIRNPEGTAPGIAAIVPRPGREPAHIFALPGVPAELKQMWPDVAERIVQIIGASTSIVHRRIKCFGVGESELEKMLPDLIRRGREPSVGITASEATITLRITSHGETPAAALEATEETVRIIYECLGTIVYGEEEDELEDVVVRLLKERNASIAVAEYGSAGLISQRMAAADPDGECFRGGTIIRMAKNTSAQLRPLVEKLAADCRESFKADYALAVGPYPHFDRQGAADVWFALASPNGVLSLSRSYRAHSSIAKVRTAKMALDFVRLELLKRAGSRG